MILRCQTKKWEHRNTLKAIQCLQNAYK